MNILRKSVILIITIIMMVSAFGLSCNESMAQAIDLDTARSNMNNASRRIRQLDKEIRKLADDKKALENKGRTSTANYYKTKEDLEQKRSVRKEVQKVYNVWKNTYDTLVIANNRKKKSNNNKSEETKKTSNTTKKESETTTTTTKNASTNNAKTTTEKATENKTKSAEEKTTTKTLKNTISDDVPKIDCYKFVLNRGPRINKLTSDKNGVTLELNDGDPISGIFVYKTEKEVRTTKDKDTKVSNENKTLKILKSVIGNENKFKIVLKDKNGNNSKFYLIAKKDGNTFKTNRSPKITEITGFGDKDFNEKAEAKENSMLTFKIADGSKTLKNVVIYDNEKEVVRVTDIKKGEDKTFIKNDYCKIYSKAGEDFIRLDVYTKKFEMKDSQINVRVKATDGEGLPTVEHLNMKLVKR